MSAASHAGLPLVGKARDTETSEPSEHLRAAREYPFTTRVLQPNPMHQWTGPEIYDAANECAHGFLPTDTPPRAEREDLVELWELCDCWHRRQRPDGRAEVTDKSGTIHTTAAAPAPVTPDAPKVETPVPTLAEPEVMPAIEGPAVYVDLPPFVQHIVNELDGETERLRDELHKLATVRTAITEDE